MSDIHNPSTTSDAAASLLGIYYDKVLIENLYPELRMYELAEKRPLPKNIAKTITFSKITKLPVSTTSLTEGVAPSPTWLSASQITATIEQLGTYVPLSDVLVMTAIDPVIKDTAMELGHQAGASVDRYIYSRCFGKKAATGGDAENALFATHTYDFSAITYDRAGSYAFSTSFFSLNGTVLTAALAKSFFTTVSASTAAEYGLTVDTVRRAVHQLRRTDVPAFKDGSYVMVVHPDSAHTLERDEEFKDWASAQYAEKMFNGEIGKIAGCRIVTSSQVAEMAGSTLSVGTVVSGVFNVILGPKALAVTEIDGSTKTYIKPAGSSAADPLDQVSTVGWKWTGSAIVTDASRGRIVITLKN